AGRSRDESSRSWLRKEVTNGFADLTRLPAQFLEKRGEDREVACRELRAGATAKPSLGASELLDEPAEATRRATARRAEPRITCLSARALPPLERLSRSLDHELL